MDAVALPNDFPRVLPTPAHLVELERLGDQIAELSAHLDAASARLLDLIREFDARDGWNTGFRSCADWLSWRAMCSSGSRRTILPPVRSDRAPSSWAPGRSASLNRGSTPPVARSMC